MWIHSLPFAKYYLNDGNVLENSSYQSTWKDIENE